MFSWWGVFPGHPIAILATIICGHHSGIVDCFGAEGRTSNASMLRTPGMLSMLMHTPLIGSSLEADYLLHLAAGRHLVGASGLFTFLFHLILKAVICLISFWLTSWSPGLYCRVRQALVPRDAMLSLKPKRGLPCVVSNCVLFINSHNNFYYLL